MIGCHGLEAFTIFENTASTISLPARLGKGSNVSLPMNMIAYAYVRPVYQHLVPKRIGMHSSMTHKNFSEKLQGGHDPVCA